MGDPRDKDGRRVNRRRSRYAPGAAYRPSEKSISARHKEILQLLRECGRKGLTRFDMPEHLSLSPCQRISELRKMGYRIDSPRETVGEHPRVARYVLVSEPDGPESAA